jgi:exosortase
LQLSQVERRWGLFAVWVVLASLGFWKTSVGLLKLSQQDETYSFIPIIPLIVFWLFYTERKQAADLAALEFKFAGLILAPAALATILAVRCGTCSYVNRLSLCTLGLVLVWVSGFVLFMGIEKARKSLFSLCFLLFAVPIPDFLLSRIVYFLQAGSADITEVIFNLSGAPVLRQGFIFLLPKISIDIAPECSGIRSSVALAILALLLAHFAFRPIWKKLVFVFAGLCMMLIKNGIRIATLTLLANYVNPGFLYGDLHHKGGVVFFLIGLVLLIPVFLILHRGESPAKSA